jgi:hypothetical protein
MKISPMPFQTIKFQNLMNFKLLDKYILNLRLILSQLQATFLSIFFVLNFAYIALFFYQVMPDYKELRKLTIYYDLISTVVTNITAKIMDSQALGCQFFHD